VLWEWRVFAKPAYNKNAYNKTVDRGEGICVLCYCSGLCKYWYVGNTGREIELVKIAAKYVLK